MEKSYILQMSVDDDAKSFIADFNSLFGCTATCTRESDGWMSVRFTINREKITRGAGRPRKDRTIDKSVAEVYAYAETHTQRETAAWLGLSLRTYQRYIKSLDAWGLWREDVSDIFQKQLEKKS